MLSLSLYRHYERKAWLAQNAAKFLYLDAPGPVETQENNLAAVLICRNVEDYIDEWIRYHELAGVKHFYIYDNGSDDSTAARTTALDGRGLEVKVHAWALKTRADTCLIKAQEMAYAHAIFNYRYKHRWMAFIDIDEFIVPRHHLTVIDALENLQNHSNISLTWAQFGHCGHMTRPPDPCVFAYQLRHQESRHHSDHFKCIVDPCQVSMASIHEYCTLDMGKKTINAQGQVELNSARSSASGFASNENIQLNHYRTKSIEENNAKLGFIMHGLIAEERRYRITSHVQELSTNVVEDKAAIDFLSRHGINNSQEYSQYIKGKT